MAFAKPGMISTGQAALDNIPAQLNLPREGMSAGQETVHAETRSEEHTSELQSRGHLHSFPTRRSSDLRGEGEQDSGLKANSDSGGKANGFRSTPEWLSRSPE